VADQQHGHALVTGAIGGLGTAIVRRLLNEGYEIVACDRREELVNEWLLHIPGEQRKHVNFYPLNVASEEQVLELARTLEGAGLHIAYLINNAGINGAGEVWALESRIWERVLRVNLYGTFYMTRAFSHAMIERKFGRVVNLASLYAYHPGEGEAPYAAAKAGITGYTRSTALDLAQHGITVNVIAPGIIWHEGLKGVVPEDTVAKMTRRIPVGRAGKPEEIAATVAFLCSNDAAYITGQTIHVNGGWYLPG
jgi:NAD(P)-dependent dehydrogenase (short-subunit alcohol dehydrogenase family)